MARRSNLWAVAVASSLLGLLFEAAGVNCQYGSQHPNNAGHHGPHHGWGRPGFGPGPTPGGMGQPGFGPWPWPNPGGMGKPGFGPWPNPGGMGQPGFGPWPNPGGMGQPGFGPWPNPGGMGQPGFGPWPNPGGMGQPGFGAWPNPGGMGQPGIGQGQTAKLTQGGTAPPSYTSFPGVGAYKFHAYGADWAEAKRVCEQEGAKMLVVNSAAEANIIKGLFQLQPNRHSPGAIASNHVWVGVQEKGTHGKFFTNDGQPLEQTGFLVWSNSPPQPNDQGANDCVSFFTSSVLYDDPCNIKYPFVCEF